MSNNCSSPPSIANGYIAIQQPFYSHGDKIYYVCNTGYYVDGNPLMTCDGSSGNWTGSAPSCSVSTTTPKTDETDEAWKWLTIGLVVGLAVLLLLLVVVLLIKLCLRLCRRTSRRGKNSSDLDVVHVGCCYACCALCCVKCCCRRCLTQSDAIVTPKPTTERPNVYVNHSPPPEPTLTPTTSDVALVKREQKIAKEVLNVWKPHSHPIRQINTSTK